MQWVSGPKEPCSVRQTFPWERSVTGPSLCQTNTYLNTSIAGLGIECLLATAGSGVDPAVNSDQPSVEC